MIQKEIPLELTSFKSDIKRIPTEQDNLYVVSCSIYNGFTVVGSYLAFPNENITETEGYEEAYLDAVKTLTSINPEHSEWVKFKEYAVKDIENE